MMSNEGEKKCPLCAEEMDWTDQQLKPCKCGYEVCVWCWHHMMDMAEKDGIEGRCPACRAPYDKEKIVGTEAKCEMLVVKKERETKSQKPKPKKQEERKDLSNVRVIQRKMAYVIGLPLSLADEDLLQRNDYFGQYGNVSKISLSRTAGGTIQQFINDTCSVYITYSKEEEAIRCIQSVHGFVLEGRSLRASFGTAKYCHAWLKNVVCNNPACLYLHSIGADEDSFGKDEEAAVNTRNRVHQIVGSTHNMQWRSGSMLPPPLDEPFNNNSTLATDKSNSLSSKKELNSNGPLSSSMPPKDQVVRIKTPNRSFLDVVARPNSGPELANVDEDQNSLTVCSDFSSLVIDVKSYDTEHSNGISSTVSSIGQSPITVLDNDSSHYTADSFAEPECYHFPLPAKDSQNSATKSFTDPSIHSVSGIVYHTNEQSCLISEFPHSNLEEDIQVPVIASTYTTGYSDSSNGYDQRCKGSGARDIDADFRNVNGYGNEVLAPYTFVSSSSANGCIDTKVRNSDLERKSRLASSLSNEEIVGQLRRLDDNNLTGNVDRTALEAVESNIVSSILSLDFDSFDDSLTLPHSLNELYGASDGRDGSRWNSNKSDRSKFSFAEEGSYTREASGFNSSFNYGDQGSKDYSLFSDHGAKFLVDKVNLFSSGPQHNGLKTQTSAPPGFSVAPRDPPPGFVSYERIAQLQPLLSGNYLGNNVSYPDNHSFAPSYGHSRSASDLDFNDPAILVVRGGKSTDEVNNLSLDSWQTSTTPQHTTYDDETRLWLLMQQTGATQQGTKFPPTFVQNSPSVRQESNFPVTDGDRFSYTGNNYGINSWVPSDQTYSPSLYMQFPQQTYGNGVVPNGYWSNRDESRPKGELGVPEVQRNDRLGFDKFFPGHRDLMYQMPSSGDVYNRVYGL